MNQRTNRNIRRSLDPTSRFLRTALFSGLLYLAAQAAYAAGPDLSIAVTVSPNPANIGDTITYHCVVTNVGDQVESDDPYLYISPDNSNTSDIYTSYQATNNPTPYFTDQTGFKYIHFNQSSIAAGASTTLDLHYTATANGHPERLIGAQAQDDADPTNSSHNYSSDIGSSLGEPSSAVNHAVVPGFADPYLAGMPDGSSVKSDTAPKQSPTRVSNLRLSVGDVLTFEATGQTDYNGGGTDPNADAADGSNFLAETADDGISGCTYPLNSLVGVFLDGKRPDQNEDGTPSTPPDSLDFSPGGNVSGGTDYTSLSPQLRQLFFIGNGKTSTGAVQKIVVPAGATRLYLASTDGSGWYNNSGAFQVTVHGGTAIVPPGTCVPNPGGLVSQFSAEGSARDSAGPNNGTLHNGATFAAGEVGQAFSFDGVDDYVDIPYSPSLNPGTITLEAWINPQSINQGSRIISKDSTATSCAPPTVVYSLEARGNQGNRADFFFTTADGNFYELVGTSVLQTGVFTHVAATYDGTTAKIYVNGVLENTLSAAGPLKTSDAPTAIGSGGPACRASNGGQIEFKGLIDEVSLYSRALSGDEIASIYNAGSAGQCRNGNNLSGTTLSVNGSSSPSSLAPDYPIVFQATQTDTKDVLAVRVQSGPSASGPWTNLDTGYGGEMVYDIHDGHYVLSTENYPTGSNIYFRASATSSAKADSNSAPVGPFNITANKPHLPPTKFKIEGTTQRFLLFVAGYPLNFFATNSTTASGIYLRLQSSSSPEDETSWSDIDDGNRGILDSLGGGNYQLNSSKYSNGNGLYFRVIAAAPGFGDSISNFVGYFDLPQNQAPTVTITNPSSGTADNPFQLSYEDAQQFDLSATGSDADGSVREMDVLVDGRTVYAQIGPDLLFRLTLNQGRHTISVVAIDRAGARGQSDVIVAVGPQAKQATSYTLKQSGDWNDPGNWIPNGVPGALDSADTGIFTPSISSGTHITVSSLSGGNLSGAGSSSSSLTITKTFNWSGGTISGVTLELANGATGELKVPRNGGDFDLEGTAIINNVGATISVDIDSFISGVAMVKGAKSGSSLTNAGTLSAISQALLAEKEAPPPFLLRILKDQASKKFNGLALIRNTGTVLLNGAVFDFSTGSPASSSRKAEAAPTGFIQEGGVLDLGAIGQAGAIVGDVTVNGGTVTGSGAIVGNLSNNSGLVAPGHSGGVISVTGSYTQGADATLALQVGGPNANTVSYDQLQIAGTANLNGALSVKTIDGYSPEATDNFVPISYGTVSGGFSSVSSNGVITLSSTGASLAITGSNPKPSPLLNIATRLAVQTGDDALIGGFIVTGTASKKVIVRAIGPSLGVNGSLVNPTLELNLADGSVITNDNWKVNDQTGQSQQAQIEATSVPPSDDLESAIVATLPPGAYTAVVRGKGDTTGVGLVEVYDLDQSVDATIANISTRGKVQTGDNVMIGGFIVGGNSPATVIVRAIGPSLAAAGVVGALADPVVEVHDTYGGVIGNNDWRETQNEQIAATGIPPSDAHESAVLGTLVPGAYTVVVHGKDDTTGIALVEAYNLP